MPLISCQLVAWRNSKPNEDYCPILARSKSAFGLKTSSDCDGKTCSQHA